MGEREEERDRERDGEKIGRWKLTEIGLCVCIYTKLDPEPRLSIYYYGKSLAKLENAHGRVQECARDIAKNHISVL